MKVGLACDHAGFGLKFETARVLGELGHEVVDLGAHSLDPQDDYPDFAYALARALQEGRVQRGVVLCGSGVGACVVANKVRGVRACLCHDTYSARQGVEHDDINVLCLGARVIGPALATELIKAFMQAQFSPEERHVRRLGKVKAIEAQG